jgi:hypothetical protein
MARKLLACTFPRARKPVGPPPNGAIEQLQAIVP